MAVRDKATYIRLPTTKLLSQELTSITKDWFTLGIHLGLDIATLHSIEAQHKLDLQRSKVEMFNMWIKGSRCPSVSWESVAVALEELSENVLADSIRSKYLVPTEGQFEEVCVSSKHGVGYHLAKMESELAKIIVDLQEELERVEVPVRRLQRYLEALLKTGGKFSTADTLDEIFVTLQSHYCIFNYSIISNVVENFVTVHVPSLSEQMQSYQTSLNTFLNSTSVEEFVAAIKSKSFSLDRDATDVVLKLKDSWLEVTILHLQVLLQQLFQEDSKLLTHMYIVRGSVLIHYQAPSSASQSLINRAKEHAAIGNLIGVEAVFIGKTAITFSPMPSFSEALEKVIFREQDLTADQQDLVTDFLVALVDIEGLNKILLGACMAGRPDAVEKLIVLGAHQVMEQALGVALKWGCSSVVEVLVEHGVSGGPSKQTVTRSVSHLDDGCDDVLPLIEAIKTANDDMMVALLNWGSNVNVAERRTGDTPLILACSEGNSTFVKRLLEAGASPQAQNLGGYTALMIATESGDTEIVEMLLDYGTNPNSQRDDGYTALMVACAAGHREIADSLLLHEADVNIESVDRVTALMVAVMAEESDLVELLLNAGANVNFSQANGVTSLMEASSWDYVDIVKILVRSDLEIDAQNEEGNTALMFACSNQYPQVVEILLSTGACPNLQNNAGESALMAAAYLGYEEIVALLLGSGAEVDLQNSNGETALMSAAENGCGTIVEQLLNVESVDANIRDKNGQTALSYAAKNHHADIVELLLDYQGIDAATL